MVMETCFKLEKIKVLFKNIPLPKQTAIEIATLMQNIFLLMNQHFLM